MAIGFMTAAELGVRNHLAILPCGGLSPRQPRMWTTESLAPYVAYMRAGAPADRMFGGVIFKPVQSSRGTYYDPLYAGFAPPADLPDWARWIQELFTPGTNLHVLASLSADDAPDVWIALPYPHTVQLNFGKLGSENLSFARTQDRIAALQWWIGKFVSVWASKAGWTGSMRLRGFVWPRASVYAEDLPVVRQVNASIRAMGFRSLWLPHYGSYGIDQWRNHGFDAAVIDSNYTGRGAFDASWLRNACLYAKTVRTGIQIVAGRGTVYDEGHADAYLNAGLAEGFMGDALKVYSFPNRTLGQLIAEAPGYYDRLYAFLKGQYAQPGS